MIYHMGEYLKKMQGYYYKKLYQSKMFDVALKHKAIIIELKCPTRTIISSWHNGGYNEDLKYIVNQTVEDVDYTLMDEMPIDEYQKYLFSKINLDADKTAGLITSACMDNAVIEHEVYKDLNVTAIVTAGADKNGIKASDPASFYEHNHKYEACIGTINIIVLINANLDQGTLVNAIITATEAKTSVLEDLKVESQYSNAIATGTGTDGICITSNKNSSNHIENAGKHSKLGELIAQTVRRATFKALELQTFMSVQFQYDVISRLTRFNIDFDELYKRSNFNSKVEYASKLYHFISLGENISWASMIINLVDEVNNNTLKLEDVSCIIKRLTQNYIGVDVDYKFNKSSDIIDYMVLVINEKIR